MLGRMVVTSKEMISDFLHCVPYQNSKATRKRQSVRIVFSRLRGNEHRKEADASGITDLKQKTGPSFYCLESEAKES